MTAGGRIFRLLLFSIFVGAGLLAFGPASMSQAPNEQRPRELNMPVDVMPKKTAPARRADRKRPPLKKIRCENFLILTITGTIDPATRRYLERVIDAAEADDDTCVIMELDTPGGLMDSMKEMATKMINTPVPVIVFVYPSGSTATSAGFFLLMASDVAAMAPSTSTGSAHPVQMQGEMDETMKEKVTNYAAAYIESLARRQGRNVRFAKKAVTRSLSVTEEKASADNVIEVVADSPNDLIEKLDGREFVKKNRRCRLDTKGASLRRLGMITRERFLHMIAHPNIAYILFMIGVYGLIFEVTHPGAIGPGAVGAVALVLAFTAFQVIPINTAGLILLVGAFVLFIIEVKVASHGLLTAGGTILLILGSLMLVDSSDPSFRISLSLIITSALFSALVFGVALAFVVKTHRTQVTTGVQGMLGKRGKTKTPLTPEGKALVHGEIWSVVSADGAAIDPDTRVEVVGIDGMELKVRRLE